MASHALGLEVEIQCSANKFYGFFKNHITQLQSYFPETFKSIHVTEGYQPSVGSLRFWKYELGIFLLEKPNFFANRWSSDHHQREDGICDPCDKCSCFQIKLLSVTPTREGVSLAKCRCICTGLDACFDNSRGDSSIPSAFIQFLRMVSVELASQRLKEG
ncbi:hypothetical protein MKW92_046585 [Papaver armeniacum]|nr:hypothetical protein MKW92_046585 [Papaver armeniacum]